MGAVGQSYATQGAGSDWPRTDFKSYTASIDYAGKSSKEDHVRVQGNNIARGGGFVPLQGEVHTTNFVSGNYAWNLNAQGQPNAQPGAAETRQLLIWATPAGFIKAAQQGKPVVVFGDGQQARGNTYVDDCVRATIAAVQAPVGEVYNVGGGEIASVWDILTRLEKIGGRKIEYRQEPGRPGDQRHTFADTGKLRRHLGWQPCTTLEEGLKRQWDWQLRELSSAP